MSASTTAATRSPANREQSHPPEDAELTEWSIRRGVRGVYHYLHFNFPHFYRSRIQRVMDAAHLTEDDLMLLMTLNARNGTRRRAVPDSWKELIGDFPKWTMKLKLNPNSDEVTPRISTQSLGTPNSRKLVLPEALKRFHKEWETFTANASREWTTLNIVSALLLTYVHRLA
jgi:hypothetical protein